MNRALADLAALLKGVLSFGNPAAEASASREAAAWRRQDLARLSGAPGIDIAAVGRLIGAGLQHHIYEYNPGGQPMVLKLLLPNFWLRFPTVAEAEQDLKLVSTYLAPFAVQPAAVVPLADGSYAVVQRRLQDWHNITRRDLDHPVIAEQMADLIARNREMLAQTGRSLDFLGREGQRSARAALLGLRRTLSISNLVVETQPDGAPRIRVLDTDLENFRPGARSLRDLRSALAARLAIAINRLLLRRLFNIDVGALERKGRA